MTNFGDIKYIKGVGPKIATLLTKLGIESIYDFLTYFPRSYDDRRQLDTISQLGQQEWCSFVATIRSLNEDVKGRTVIMKCLLEDGSGSIVGVWFNQKYLKKLFRPGLKLYVKGKLEFNRFVGQHQLQVSDFELLTDVTVQRESVGRILPVYSLIHGLQQYKMRQISREILDQKLTLIQDPLPDYIQKDLSLFDLRSSIQLLHYPTSQLDYNKARYRIVFDDFFYFQLSLGKQRQHSRERHSTAPLITEGMLIDRYMAQLPYQLTSAQQTAVDHVKQDVGLSVAMNRLVQGDVGCGKTDIAVISLLFALQTGLKGAFMAPTELLAEQHYLKISHMLLPFGIDVVFLKGKMRVKEKRLAHERLMSSKLCIVVGTHALIQDAVEISNLGLVVIDEQHRFGVNQRQQLWDKGDKPHCLYLTATPIPRSLMLTCFGDLDKTIIDELPPGRIPSSTRFVRPYSIEKVYHFCFNQLRNGRQLYFVFPLVDESEKLDLQAAIQNWDYLSKTVFKEYKVGLLHGKLKSDEKQVVMDQFRENKIQILVATTVIEVGIDVPNASVMVIHHAERFGLSQLHQLRGRIGRGQKESFCFLLADPKNDNAKKRIKAMLETSDGFKIAEQDLMIRGPGDMLGTRQAGLPNFKLAHLIKDEKVLVAARMIATRLLREDPNLALPKHHKLRTYMTDHYENSIDKQLN